MYKKKQDIRETPLIPTRALSAISKGGTSIADDDHGMTARRKLFCEHYIVHRNARNAALHVGYPPGSAYNAGSLMLKNMHVREYLKTRMAEVVDLAEMHTNEWAFHLRAVAFSKVGDLFDENGKLIPLHLLPEQVQASIASFEMHMDRFGDKTYNVKFWPKAAGLDVMARHLGLYKADNDQRPNDNPLKIEFVGD